MRFLSHLVSFLFHPIFIPTYAILFLVLINPYKFGQPYTYDFIFIIRTVILYSILYPLFTLFLMKNLDFIDSFATQSRTERVAVYIPTSFYFTWTFIVFLKSDYDSVLADVMLGATIGLCAALFLTIIHSKISAHATGMGGLFTIVLFSPNIATIDVTYFLIATIFVAGLVGTSRLVLGAHTPSQVYNGYMLGFISMAIALII